MKAGVGVAQAMLQCALRHACTLAQGGKGRHGSIDHAAEDGYQPTLEASSRPQLFEMQLNDLGEQRLQIFIRRRNAKLANASVKDDAIVALIEGERELFPKGARSDGAGSAEGAGTASLPYS